VYTPIPSGREREKQEEKKKLRGTKSRAANKTKVTLKGDSAEGKRIPHAQRAYRRKESKPGDRREGRHNRQSWEERKSSTVILYDPNEHVGKKIKPYRKMLAGTSVKHLVRLTGAKGHPRR